MSRNATSSQATAVEPEIRELLVLCSRHPRVAAQFVGKLWLAYLNNLTGDRVPFGQRDYARFVIVGRYRSGSNMVRGSLMAHSRIVAFGDVFRTPRQPSFGLPFYRSTESSRQIFGNDPVAFLETRVFARMPRRVEAVGLKLLYASRRNDLWTQVRDALARSPGVRAIHVKRENVLRSYLSNVQRLRHGRWKDISGDEERLQPVQLTYEECIDAFVKTREWEEEHDALFPNDRRVDVYYERLCADYVAETTRITDFLGVRSEPIRPLTHKQGHARLRDAIANYDVLRERFQGSPWERFFEENA